MPEIRNVFHLWFDCETTGLDIKSDVVLEVAWVVTDDRFRMLTPLRQRYTNIFTQPKVDSLVEWCEDNAEISVAAAMHQKSGLAGDWDAENERRVIRNVHGLTRLIDDDLALAGFEGWEGDRVVLAGAGVSHFDNHILSFHAPGFYPPSSGFIDGMWAYWRTLDTSMLWRTLGAPFMQVLREKAFGNNAPYSVLECEMPGPTVYRPIEHLLELDAVAKQRGVEMWKFVPDAVIPHRAADDVVDALLTARAVRAIPDLDLS